MPLVNALHKQAIQAGIPFEIILLDDCSSELLRDQNKDVSNLPFVRFYELDKNIGRASIRNRLAEMAVYGSLLFMDCDSEVPSDRYIDRYLPYCGKELVVCGGRMYRPDPPEEHEFLLRWLYGIRKEQKPDTTRKKNPYRSFMTNNFLISKTIMLQIQFDESIVQYGHEDTLFGLELKKREVPLIHIQNPLVHIGLEISWEFIRKTSEGIENLVMLLYKGKILRNDIEDIRLLKTYEFMGKFHLVNIYLFFYEFFSNTVMRNMLGPNPTIFAFDLYKLSVFSNLNKKNRALKPSFS